MYVYLQCPRHCYSATCVVLVCVKNNHMWHCRIDQSSVSGYKSDENLQRFNPKWPWKTKADAENHGKPSAFVDRFSREPMGLPHPFFVSQQPHPARHPMQRLLPEVQQVLLDLPLARWATWIFSKIFSAVYPLFKPTRWWFNLWEYPWLMLGKTVP